MVDNDTETDDDEPEFTLDYPCDASTDDGPKATCGDEPTAHVGDIYYACEEHFEQMSEWVNETDDNPETTELPSRVFAWHDESLTSIPAYLREEGVLAENEYIQRCELDIAVEEGVEITVLETELAGTPEVDDD